jgi:hypothetical protein
VHSTRSRRPVKASSSKSARSSSQRGLLLATTIAWRRLDSAGARRCSFQPHDLEAAELGPKTAVRKRHANPSHFRHGVSRGRRLRSRRP